MNDAVLNFQDVVFAYADGHKAIDGISFELAAGQTLGIVGANGAGKSTLLQLLPGVLLPAAGYITINGMRLEKSKVTAIRREVGLVFQNVEDQLFMPTVREDIAFGLRNQSLPETVVQVAVDEILAQLDITHLAERAPVKLSGGEMRLAALAAVLVMQPRLLALDEPSAALDPKARRRIMELLIRLPQHKIIASHDLDLIWDVCDRVMILQEGRIAADGATRELLADKELLETCGLELPLRFGEPIAATPPRQP